MLLEVSMAPTAILAVGWCIFRWWKKIGVEQSILALMVGASSCSYSDFVMCLP